MLMNSWLKSLKSLRQTENSARGRIRKSRKAATQSAFVEALEPKQLLSGVNPVLDQENLGASTFTQGIGQGGSGEPILSQSFTVGIKGTLDSVGFPIVRNAGGAGQVFADISAVDASGRPIGAPMATVEIDRSQLLPNPGTAITADELYRIDVSEFGIAVEPGDQLAVVLRDNVYGTLVSTPGGADTYAGGVRSTNIGSGFVVSGGRDYFFQTYVKPAEVVDQQNLGTRTLSQGIGQGAVGDPQVAQSFTVGESGRLTAVGMVITDNAPSIVGNVYADLTAADSNGLPTGPSIATVEIDRNALLPTPGAAVTADDLYRIDFSAFGIDVKEGEQLAIILRDNNPNTLTGTFGGGDTYAGGRRSLNLGSGFAGGASTDFFFQTFIEPADVVIDQEHTGPATGTQGIGRGGTGEPILAQSFTADVDGVLETVGFVITDNSPSTAGQIFADIMAVDANQLPTGSALATVEIDRNGLLPTPSGNVTADDFYQIDFSSFGIEVAAGDELAVVLRDNVYGTLAATFFSNDVYAGGRGSFNIGSGFTGNKDYFFQTSIRTNAAPDLQAIQNKQVPAGRQLSVTAVASDTDSTDLTYSLDQASLDLGVTIDAVTGSIAWTPTDGQAGTFEIVVTVHDDEGACDSVDFLVTAIAEAPGLEVTTSTDVVNEMDGLTSLREALSFANSNPDFSEITFGDGSSLTGGADFTDATPDTILLGGTELQIASDVTINAPGANVLTVSGNDLSRVFKVTAGDVVLAGLTVTEGQTTSANALADRTGAGLKIESGASVRVIDSSFSNNVAAGSGAQGANGLNGGGISNAGTLEILSSSLSNNSARMNGGTIWNTGDLSVANSTITGGRARINGGGGGGALFNEGTASFLNSTVTGNSAVLGGGIHNIGTLTTSNSLVAGNQSENAIDIFGTVTGQNNLIGDAASAGGLVDGTDGNIVGVDWTTVLENNGTNPALTDNGGTTLTVALLPGAVARDAGDDAAAALLATDQRGESRFVGTVDIGAFEVQNQAPTADAGGPYTVVEGSDVNLNAAGSIDPDDDALTYEWDFNYDGTTFDVDATGETPDFTGIDDGDVIVALRVSDGAEVSEVVTTTVTVTNADPAIGGLTTDSATLASKSDDGVVTLSGFVTDAGTLDTHEVVVDWGDGNVETVVTTGDLVASPDLAGTQHTYAAGGSYIITVTVTDDDGGSVTQSTSAVVQGVGVVNGVLYIIGTDGKDIVDVRESNQGTQLKVTTKFDVGNSPGGFETDYFDIADVDRIEIHVCGGNDLAKLTHYYWWNQHGIDIPALINGGDGNDYLVGGNASDELNGGAGHDVIFGSSGNDVIDGGEGNDCLHGESGDDTIYGGEGNDWIYGGWGDDIVYAGAGDDYVWGGFGNDILLGQSGNDCLFGGWGRDIIIAGEGADRLYGQGQDDILITGDTNRDDDEDALKAMRDLWTGSGSASSRAQMIHDSGLEVIHDDDVDKAWGGWGLDWLLFDSDLDRVYC